MKIFLLPFLILLNIHGLQAQEKYIDTLPPSKELHFKYTSLIIPSVLIGYGLIGIESDQLKLFNAQIKEEVNEHIDDRFTIDDISQYAPIAAVYSLNLAGVTGKNNFKDRTVIIATATLIMTGTVRALKPITKVERPDGSSLTSFPSGHTATAFMGAEFLWQEYKDVSPWYGIAGYAVAAGTGAFRIYNDRHWLTDVAAGAGIGILSTKIAYWLHPAMDRLLFGAEKTTNSKTSFAPFYNGKQTGVGMVMQF